MTFEWGRASILHGGMETRWEVKSEHELFPGFYRLRESDQNFLGSGGFDGCLTAALDDLISTYEDGGEPESNLHTVRNTHALLDAVVQKLEYAQ